MTAREDWRPLFELPLRTAAPDIAGLLTEQAERESATVNLIASECYCPRATLEAEASILVNKNATGYPGKRAIGGAEVLDKVEGIAIERAKRLFGAEHANVQSLSSTIANVAVLRALLDKGDRILSFDMAAGGHVSHGGGAHISGQDYRVETFGIDEASGGIDLSTARERAERFRPRIIIAGSSSYPRRIDYRALQEIATEFGAILFADIAHVAGLVVSGLHPNPAPPLPTWSPHPPTRPCAAPARAVSSSARAGTERRSTPPSIRDSREHPAPISSLAGRSSSTSSGDRRSVRSWERSSPTRRHSPSHFRTPE